MTLEGLIYLLLWVIVIVVLLCAAGWGAKWIIGNFLPAPAQMPALAIVGVILLIVLLLLCLQLIQGGAPTLRLK